MIQWPMRKSSCSQTPNLAILLAIKDLLLLLHVMPAVVLLHMLMPAVVLLPRRFQIPLAMTVLLLLLLLMPAVVLLDVVFWSLTASHLLLGVRRGRWLCACRRVCAGPVW